MTRSSRWLLGVSVANLVFLYLPIVVLTVFSFNASRLSSEWRGFTLQWYRDLAVDAALWSALRNSVLIACISTGLSLVLGVGAAIGLERVSSRVRQWMDGVLVLPLVIPEVMLGVALMLLFLLMNIPLSLVTMTIGHVVFTLPLVIVILRARLRKLDPRLEEAARDLGASEWQAFSRVTLPLLTPALVGAALMAFTVSFDDFIVTFFTSGPGSTTLPLRVYSMVKAGVSPEINALSTILVVVSMGLVAGAVLFQRRPVPR
jgi:spermidine/putrescine transport system permease protein